MKPFPHASIGVAIDRVLIQLMILMMKNKINKKYTYTVIINNEIFLTPLHDTKVMICVILKCESGYVWLLCLDHMRVIANLKLMKHLPHAPIGVVVNRDLIGIIDDPNYEDCN